MSEKRLPGEESPDARKNGEAAPIRGDERGPEGPQEAEGQRQETDAGQDGEGVPPQVSPAEAERAYRQSMAFNTEAARAGLFAAAMDMAETMKNAGIPDGEAALLTGAVEMAAQLWMQVMLQAGQTPMAARKALEKQIRTFAIKHSRQREEARPS